MFCLFAAQAEPDAFVLDAREAYLLLDVALLELHVVGAAAENALGDGGEVVVVVAIGFLHALDAHGVVAQVAERDAVAAIEGVLAEDVVAEADDVLVGVVVGEYQVSADEALLDGAEEADGPMESLQQRLVAQARGLRGIDDEVPLAVGVDQLLHVGGEEHDDAAVGADELARRLVVAQLAERDATQRDGLEELNACGGVGKGGHEGSVAAGVGISEGEVVDANGVGLSVNGGVEVGNAHDEPVHPDDALNVVGIGGTHAAQRHLGFILLAPEEDGVAIGTAAHEDELVVALPSVDVLLRGLGEVVQQRVVGVEGEHDRLLFDDAVFGNDGRAHVDGVAQPQF